MESFKVQLSNKQFLVKYSDFGKELLVDKLLKIDYRNLAAELITFPVLMNKLGLLLADAENAVKEQNLALEGFTAKRKMELRDDLNELKKVERLTQDDIKYKQDALLRNDPIYIKHNRKLLELEKTKSYVSSIYWAAKDKSDKLNTLSEKMHPEALSEQIEYMVKQINGITISQ